MTIPSKIDLFIQRMLENEEQERWGYEFLLKQEDFSKFFDLLNSAGLFAAERNPGPIPAKETGYFHVPYWSALDYLEACAKLSSEKNNHDLATKVMDVVRTVSVASRTDGNKVDNYHTYRKFADIIGLLPSKDVLQEDMNLLPVWLAGQFDRGLVCHSLDKGAVKKFLESETPQDWDKAVRALFHCTELAPKKGQDKVQTVVEDYWLTEFIQHHSTALGAKAGRLAADIFLGRLREVFGSEDRQRLSYLFRPAIEDHAQNHEWDGPENRMVEGLRDVLLGWIDHAPEEATQYVSELLICDIQIAKRIALYVINQRWTHLQNAFTQALDSSLFESGFLHEMYGLLRNHFAEMEVPLQQLIISSLRSLPPMIDAEDAARLLRVVQRNWLSAITSQGSSVADQWFAELNADASLGTISKHPDFHMYMESSWGDGPSVFNVQDLIAFALAGNLIEQLNGFVQTNRWEGPTKRGLCNALEEAVVSAPKIFIGCLASFLTADRAYQYALINGLKRVWEKPESTEIDWDITWGDILNFFQQMLGPSFWGEEVHSDADLTPNRDWIPSVIADFLRSGTHDDNRAYSPSFLNDAWIVLELLLDHAESVTEPSDDAMFQATNSPKGKAIEALFSHALRICRVSDKTTGGHSEVWQGIQARFDLELEKCTQGNYEFLTLSAAYLSNLEYLDFAWLEKNFVRIFPTDNATKLNCALGGLAFAPATRKHYALLVSNSIIDAGLEQFTGKREFKERLVERVALAYLWGDESLDSPRFIFWFNSSDFDALQIISRFFWSVRNQELSHEQEAGVIKYWHECVTRFGSQKDHAKHLLSSLSKLVCYIDDIGEHEAILLLAVTPFVHIGHHSDMFIENLERLAEANPKQVCDILKTLLKSYTPVFDFKNRLKSLIEKLATHGMVEDAILIADHLRTLPGMTELFDALQHNANKKSN